MRWTKRKQMLESVLADPLKGHIEVNRIVYRKSHDQQGKLTITYDKIEIFTTDNILYDRELYYTELLFEKTGQHPTYDGRMQHLMGDTTKEEKEKFREAMERSQEELYRAVENKGVYADYTIYNFFIYNQLSIEEALAHPHELIRAYAMLDARTGKRKLEEFKVKEEHPLVKKFLGIRASVIAN